MIVRPRSLFVWTDHHQNAGRNMPCRLEISIPIWEVKGDRTIPPAISEVTPNRLGAHWWPMEDGQECAEPKDNTTSPSSRQTVHSKQALQPWGVWNSTKHHEAGKSSRPWGHTEIITHDHDTIWRKANVIALLNLEKTPTAPKVTGPSPYSVSLTRCLRDYSSATQIDAELIEDPAGFRPHPNQDGQLPEEADKRRCLCSAASNTGWQHSGCQTVQHKMCSKQLDVLCHTQK